MKINSSEKGQALILIAFAMIGLVGFGALAIDGGMVYSDRRHAQNAADTAALSAALAKVKGQNFTTAAQNMAANNGYVDAATNQDVTVYNPPINGPYTGNNEYIQVKITSTISTTFARVIGRQQVTNVVEAVVRAQGSAAGSPFYNGAGVVTLKPDGAGTFLINGNVTLDIVDSGTFVNSTSNCAMNANGNITMSVDTSFAVVGTLCQNGNITRNGPVTQAAPVPYPPVLDIPQPTIACTGNGYQIGNTYYPGNWAGTLSFNGNGAVVMAPGNYCLSNGASFNGNVNITALNVNVRLTGGQFLINGNSTFTCANAVFFSDGGSGFRFNGNGTNNCTNVLFYARTGEVLWNGNVSSTFQAPTSGPYKGLLIYMPYENTTPLTINGNAGNNVTGTILAVRSDVTINGNSGTEVLNSQIVAYTVRLNGNGTLRLDYDGSENYAPASAPTLELAQ